MQSMTKHKVTTKKAGLVTKIVIFILLGYTTIALLNLYRQVAAAEEEVTTLNQQVQTQKQRNLELTEAIANSDKLESRKDIAREKLGLLESGEKVFYVTD
jgi:cell division protein FtsB